MKLTKLHVENFGALKNFDLTPSAGLNRLEYPNGWGKSTLAAFLRAMLFGLPSARGGEEKNERKKYAPWQGGLFGGAIELTSGLGSFRIERSFGERPAQDRLSVIDLSTGRPTDRLGEVPGETLFGMNADGFDKSVYYTRRDFPEEKEKLASITARLNSLLDNVEDAGSFDRATDKIKNERNDLKNPRGGDKLPALEDRIYEGRRKVAYLEEKREDLVFLKERLADCAAALDTLEAAEESFRRRKELDAQLQRQKKLLEEERRIKEELAKLESAFRGKLLSKEELSGLSAKLGEMQSALARANALEEAFPTDEYNHLLRQDFPDEDLLAKAEGLAKERKQCSDKLLERADQKPAEKGTSKKRSFAFAAILALLGIGLAIPALLLAKYLLLIGTALLLLGASLLLLTGVGKKRPATEAKSEEASLAQRIAQIDEAFGRLLPAFLGQPAEEESVRRLRRSKERFAALTLEKERLDSAKASAKELAGPFEELLSVYAIPEDRGNPAKTISRLGNALSQIEWNRPLLNEKEAEQKELEQAIGVLPKAPEDLLLFGEEADRKARRAELDGERKKLEREIDNLSEALDGIPELSDRIDSDEAELAHRKEKIAILDKTEAYLKAAKDALSTRYRTGISNLLPAYLKRAGGASLPESSVDPDLQVFYYAGGKSRPLSAFSQGERDLTDFCLRLSLTEALSAGGETPFLLLDDPFVNLDDQRFAAAKALLLDLAADYQIFYLVCRKGT